MSTAIVITSGKGGTGKTSLTGGVASCLAALGHRVLCIDMDIGLRNLDLTLGLSDRALMDFTDVLSGRCTLERAAVPHPEIQGLFLLTAPVNLPGTPLDEAAMKQAYLDADLYLLPSSSENSPNSLGEAMLLGLPCVASAAGATPDMRADGREGALYAPPGDAAALAGAVLRVLGAPDAGAALGAAAQARAQKTHDPAANARALAGIYTAILDGAEILNGEDTQ